MNDNDSRWKRWHVRVGVVAGVVTILSSLLLLPKNIRELIREVFWKKPAASEIKKPEEVTGHPSTSHSIEDIFVKKYVADHAQASRNGVWTVVISTGDGKTLPNVDAAAGSALSEKGYTVRPLFRSALREDSAALNELYTGNPALLERIGTYRDGVLVGKLRSELGQNTSLDMFTIHLIADVRVISAPSAKVEAQFTIDETGAGFSETAATIAAERRLADKLKQQLSQSIPPK